MQSIRLAFKVLSTIVMVLFIPSILGATRDTRDKYVLSRLLWDLGISPEETAAVLSNFSPSI